MLFLLIKIKYRIFFGSFKIQHCRFSPQSFPARLRTKSTSGYYLRSAMLCRTAILVAASGKFKFYYPDYNAFNSTTHF